MVEVDEPRYAYVLRVNAHQQGWDGTVCRTPFEFTDCQAKVQFKSESCDKGLPNCLHLNLFKDGSPSVDMPLAGPHGTNFNAVIGYQPPQAGDVVLFWATYRDQREYPVGIWKVQRFAGSDRARLHGDPSSIIRFPEKSLQWRHVDHRVSRAWGGESIRLISPVKLALVLEDFAADLQGLKARNPVNVDPAEIDRCLEQMAELKGTLSTVDPARLELEGGERRRQPRAAGLTQRIQLPTGLLDGGAAAAEVHREPDPVVAHAEVATSASPTEAVAADEEVGLDSFPESLVRDYRTALKVRQLVILAGPSGSGKTQLAISAARDIDARLLITSVRPDWRSNEDLLGYRPPFGDDFIASPFSNFVLEAADEFESAVVAEEEPREFHVVLDEMNLARPEYYMAEVLSKMELPLSERNLHLYDGGEMGSYPSSVLLPPNLKIVGTVNNDDTTFPLSPKVLDRAVYLPVDVVDLEGWFERHQALSANRVRGTVIEVDQILRPLGLSLGYRVAEQIVCWVDVDIASGTPPIAALDAAMSLLVLSKLRLQRSNPEHAEGIRRLIGHFESSGGDGEEMPRSIGVLDRLLGELERSEFAFGQLST